jgi:hypothetical protein
MDTLLGVTRDLDEHDEPTGLIRISLKHEPGSDHEFLLSPQDATDLADYLKAEIGEHYQAAGMHQDIWGTWVKPA